MINLKVLQLSIKVVLLLGLSLLLLLLGLLHLLLLLHFRLDVDLASHFESHLSLQLVHQAVSVGE